MNAEKLVTIYIKMRDARQKLQKEFDDADGKIKEQQDQGNVFRTIKTRYWTSDWGSMKAFIKDHDAVDLLEQRVHQTNMKNFLEENPDLMPPGMNIDSRYSVTVRRK